MVWFHSDTRQAMGQRPGFPTQRQSLKKWGALFPATPRDRGAARPPCPRGNPSRATAPSAALSVSFNCAEEWEGPSIMAWSPGADCHPTAWERAAPDGFPSSVVEGAGLGGAGGWAPGRAERFGPCAPPSFVQPSHASLWHILWGGGRCRPGDPCLASSPAPPECGGSPTHCPPRLGGRGLQGETRPAPTAAPSQKPSGPPPLSQADPDPGGDHPHTTKGRRGGRLTVMCGMLFLPW